MSGAVEQYLNSWVEIMPRIAEADELEQMENQSQEKLPYFISTTTAKNL